MTTVYAPNERYTGESAGVAFKDGVGKTDNARSIEWLADHGYYFDPAEPTTADPAPVDPAGGGEAAVDPAPEIPADEGEPQAGPVPHTESDGEAPDQLAPAAAPAAAPQLPDKKKQH